MNEIVTRVRIDKKAQLKKLKAEILKTAMRPDDDILEAGSITASIKNEQSTLLSGKDRARSERIRTLRSKIILHKILLSAMYTINLGISYLMMLAVMTYNVGIFFAILLGASVGHFAFNVSPVLSESDKTNTFSYSSDSGPEIQSDVCHPSI